MEFAQIETKVIAGLKTGNECLKKMHEVGDYLSQERHASQPLCLFISLNELYVPPLCQVMSIEEVERIMDETQDSIEYQRVSARDSHSVTGAFLLTAQPNV